MMLYFRRHLGVQFLLHCKVNRQTIQGPRIMLSEMNEHKLLVYRCTKCIFQ